MAVVTTDDSIVVTEEFESIAAEVDIIEAKVKSLVVVVVKGTYRIRFSLGGHIPQQQRGTPQSTPLWWWPETGTASS